MSILTGEYVFAAKVESTYGVDATPDTTLNAMRVKANIDIAKTDVEAMDYDAGRTGSKGSIEKKRWVEGSLDAYQAGSGTAILPVALTPLLKAAGLAVTVQADHVAITLDDIVNASSVTGKFFRGTVSQTQLGARSSWEIELSLDALPRVRFPNYMALYSPQVVGAKPANVDLSAFKNPKPITPVNFVVKSVFGYDADIAKVVIKGGNEVVYVPESQSIEIIDRNVTVDIEFKEPTPDVFDFYGALGSYGAINLQIGQDVVDEGDIFEVAMPNAQLSTLSQSERNKIAYLNATFELVPTASNNEITMRHWQFCIS
jgi:hypothetical protein